MRRLLIVTAVVASMALTGTADAAAGCREWGQGDVAELAQTGGVGTLVSGLATSGDVRVGVIVANEHEAACS